MSLPKNSDKQLPLKKKLDKWLKKKKKKIQPLFEPTLQMIRSTDRSDCRHTRQDKHLELLSGPHKPLDRNLPFSGGSSLSCNCHAFLCGSRLLVTWCLDTLMLLEVKKSEESNAGRKPILSDNAVRGASWLC
ncbi:hypothetical protein CEXT_30991 [Caerostris extrusa]|uniref:Uncharacterized protein n=1 Tax=Caerostris extrusa TaxID=172846 RepID=A0AAV4SA83_CAEEX|nr:hypothetical protein CEXT_30991 [Caerostris extrusa]